MNIISNNTRDIAYAPLFGDATVNISDGPWAFPKIPPGRTWTPRAAPGRYLSRWDSLQPTAVLQFVDLPIPSSLHRLQFTWCSLLCED